MGMNMERLEGILERVRTIGEMIENPTSQNTQLAAWAFLGGLALFGLLNVFLGFRLIRFWMMIGSIGAGALGGYTIGWWMNFGMRESLIIGLGIGILLAILSFFVYNWGVFVTGFVGGSLGSIYLLQPTTSLLFFLCLLFGVLLGSLGMKFSRIILIFATSLLGGVLAGLAISMLGKLNNISGPLGIPYGALLGIGISLLGIVVQLAMNPEDEEEGEEEEQEEGRKVQEKKRGEVHRDDFGRKYIE